MQGVRKKTAALAVGENSRGSRKKLIMRSGYKRLSLAVINSVHSTVLHRFIKWRILGLFKDFY